MKTIRRIALACCLVLAAPVDAGAYALDAIQHVGAGLGAGLFTSAITTRRHAGPQSDVRLVRRSAALAFAGGTVAGVGKELFDVVGPGSAEFRDFAFTVVGAGMASLTSAVLTATILPTGPDARKRTEEDEANLRTLARGFITTSITLSIGVAALELYEWLRRRGGVAGQ